MPEPIVFAGPSLPAAPSAEWRQLLAACRLRPPAQRGDVLAAAWGEEPEEPATIVLLDGYYYDVPAVTHKELLYALDAGVRVIGAASLGALRAVEMAPWGMIGVGEVFAAYRDGGIDGDDEVAVLHLPAERGYRPTTVALVEVRWALRGLGGDSLIAAALKRLPFSERTAEAVLALAAAHLEEPAAAALAAHLARLDVAGVKSRDALLALRAAQEPGPRPALRERRATIYLDAFRVRYARAPQPGAQERLAAPTYGETWQTAQLLHPGTADFVAALRRRHLLAAAAAHAGLAPAPERVAELCARLAAHLADCGIALPAPERLAEAREQAGAEFAVERWGGADAALGALAGRLGVGQERDLLALLAEGPLAFAAWGLVRGFLASTAVAPAREAAAAAKEVQLCFRRWADGAGLAAAEIARLAAELWGCPPAAVGREAARRGFADPAAPSPGLREAVELLAPAERLRPAINDYPERRAALRAAALTGVLDGALTLSGDPS